MTDRTKSTSRRTLLAGAVGVAATAALPLAVRAAPATSFFARTGLPIGVQLYSLGPELAADLDRQLAVLAAIGFKTVELAGFLGRTPKALRAAFDRAGLACPSAHIKFGAAAATGAEPGLTDDLGPLAEAMHVIGAGTVIMPFSIMPKPVPGQPATPPQAAFGMTADDWKHTADFLNAKGEALKAYGLKLGYHNHNPEFAPLGETFGLEILLRNTDPDRVLFEMDAGWVLAAGRDPVELLRAHPGRFRLMHVKDLKATTRPNFAVHMDPADVGQGVGDWAKILPAAYDAGVRGFFIEQEPPFARSRLESMKTGFDYLSQLSA